MSCGLNVLTIAGCKKGSTNKEGTREVGEAGGPRKTGEGGEMGENKEWEGTREARGN